MRIMWKNFNVLLFVVLGILSSCTFKDEKAIKEVEQLQEKTAALKNDFESVDFDKVSAAKKQYDESIMLIKKYYFADTIDHRFMSSIDFYKNVKNAYKVMSKNKDIIAKNFDLVEHQLETLKTDLENSALEGEPLQQALNNENNNVRKLDSAVNVYMQNAQQLMMVHDSVADYIKHKTLTF